MSNNKNFILRFVLTNLFGARVEDVINENGDLEKSVIIPLDRNNLKVSPSGRVSVYAFVNRTLNATMYNWTHYLQMKCNPAFVKKINELGYKVPYLGNMKDSNYIIYNKQYQDKLKGGKVKINDFGDE